MKKKSDSFMLLATGIWNAETGPLHAEDHCYSSYGDSRVMSSYMTSLMDCYSSYSIVFSPPLDVMNNLSVLEVFRPL